MGDIELMGRKILVTGGNGYLGKFLVNALIKEKAEVYIMDINGIENDNTFIVDISNRDDVEKIVHKIQPEIIYHLAASLDRVKNFDRYESIDKINHIGTFNLLRALKNIPFEKFIFTSTSEVYGSNKFPFHESQNPLATSPYSLTKIHAENLILTYCNLYNKHFTILRLFNFFGKDMPTEFFIPQMIQSLKNESYFDMTNGAQKRDYLFIEDVIQALVLSGIKQKAKNEIFNVCSGNASTLKELVSETHDRMQSSCDVRYGAIPYRKNEIWNMLGDNKKIKNALGFKVNYSLKQGIEALISDEITSDERNAK